MKRQLRAFTLIELMLVMAIMGLLGTISIGGFRAMRRGMEQSAVMRNVDQFIHNAYQRAVLDRQPTVIYFWNETKQAETDSETLLVVGHAVAVRQSGRITAKDGSYLIDEFGDLRHSRATDEDGEEATSDEEAREGLKMYLYKMNGTESGGVSDNRSEVSQATIYKGRNLALMLTDPEWVENHSGSAGQSPEVAAYGWYTEDAGEWHVGDAYGFEFATLTLPNNYIFGSTFKYVKKDGDDAIEELSQAIRCEPGSASGTIQVFAIRPNDKGEPSAQTFKNNTSQAANSDPTQNKY